MRNYGINYDTGQLLDGRSTRSTFDGDVARRELKIIASDLHATAVRVIGDDPRRLTAAGGHALDAGLELWFAPTAYDVEPDTLVEHLLECAHRAEQLRRSAGSEVVLVLGSEMSVSCSGFIPGKGLAGRLATMTDPRTWSTPERLATLAEGSERARATHREIAARARAAFGGPITYAAGAWEDVEWGSVRHRLGRRIPRRAERGDLPRAVARLSPVRQAGRRHGIRVLRLPRRRRPRRGGLDDHRPRRRPSGAQRQLPAR